MSTSENQRFAIWEKQDIVDNFARKKPSDALLRFVEEFAASRRLRILDAGCGAGRHMRPLLASGHDCHGTDVSANMLKAAAQSLREVVDDADDRLHCAGMDALPFETASFDMIISHGVWNLARTEQELRSAMSEAARVLADGAVLYLTTFSRNTLPPDALPVSGSRFIFTDFNNEPQTFLTPEQLDAELRAVGFVRDESRPIRELNRPASWESSRGPGLTIVGGKRPVLLEGVWTRRI